jgi:uncharacterized protein with PIN domain
MTPDPNYEVSFRFYGRLNDFLPAGRRARTFTHIVAARSSVKDAIEALGVPHPEVDLVIVNGASEDFACRLQRGDRVSVYPAFRGIDLAGMPRAGFDPPDPARFAVDVHLGKLASLLRLAGFDAVVIEDDADVANTAARENRVVLTRDVALLKRGVVRHGYWIRYTEPALQLVEVLDRFALADRMEPFTRCLRCNTPLAATEPAAVAEKVPPRARAAFRRFWRCPGCARVYWQGSHYDRLTELLVRARGLASARSAG